LRNSGKVERREKMQSVNSELLTTREPLSWESAVSDLTLKNRGGIGEKRQLRLCFLIEFFGLRSMIRYLEKFKGRKYRRTLPKYSKSKVKRNRSGIHTGGFIVNPYNEGMASIKKS